MDPAWIETFKQLGVPAAALILLIWKGWPFLVKQIEDAKAERKAEIDKFDNTIRTRDGLMVQQWQEHLKALDAMTAELRGMNSKIEVLRDEVRNHKNGH